MKTAAVEIYCCKIKQHSNWLDTPSGAERLQVRILPAIQLLPLAYLVK